MRTLGSVLDIVSRGGDQARNNRCAVRVLLLDNLLAARSAITIRNDIGSDRRCAICACVCDDDLFVR